MDSRKRARVFWLSMGANGNKSPWAIVVAFALLIIIAASRHYGDLGGGEGGTKPSLEKGSPAGDVHSIKEKHGDYEVYSGCRLVDDRNNDGDSFRVRLGTGDEVVLRLYYVDAPESRRHQYNGKRIGHQAKYFSISESEAVEVGVSAKKFVLNELDQNAFTVYTKWEEVYDSGRYYAFVKLNLDGKERWLHEVLVDRGLARIYTEGATMPDGESVKQRKTRLHKQEARARDAGIGAWGL